MNLEKLQASLSPSELTGLSMPTPELCQRYEALSTAVVNDVLREHNLIHQTLPHSIMPLREGMKLVGFAFTIKGAKSLIIKNEMAERARMLESIPQHAVVAWDTSGDDESAHWGEIMTMAAVKRGCRGAVVDGGVRDTDLVLSQNFPLFVRYRSSNGMLGRFRISDWQIPIRIGKVDIFPGDLVFGDIDGVLIVPRLLAVEVLIRADEIIHAETEMKTWVQSGMSATEIVAKGGYF